MHIMALPQNGNKEPDKAAHFIMLSEGYTFSAHSKVIDKLEFGGG